MLITRKKKVPISWIFYAQLPFAMSIWANFATGAPFLFAMKKFIDNPAAIMVLINLEVFITLLGGPLVNWLSDRIWTRFGRRRPFVVFSDICKMLILPLIPFAPDIWTLIALKWAYGVVADLGSPIQALTMEVVPSNQRGKGAGFFQMQLQIVNLIYWGVVIGRFDDVYFMGPMHGLFQLSGEHLMFFSGATIIGCVAAFAWLGFKEVKPPIRKTLDDDRRGNESIARVFLRGFFKDVLSKSLLPLYLLVFVGAMAHVGLGILGPLLYTEQWGYSMQEMGTNVAIGAAISIPIAMFAGYFADATSKMKVYVGCLIAGVIMKLIWVFWVYTKPDMRPELYEIIIFGEITHIFGLIAGTVSFPLILEFVERNRLGTAGAGMSLFNQILKLAISTFVGFWIVWWSMFFLPQAGEYLELVFRQERTEAEVRTALQVADMDMDRIHLGPLHRPGVDGTQSRRWQIRRNNPDSGLGQEEIKDLKNQISKWSGSLSSPFTDEEEIARIEADIAEARAKVAELEAELTGEAVDFRQYLADAIGEQLYADGSQILAASLQDQRLQLEVEMIEPVAETLEPEQPRGGFFGGMIDSLDPPEDLGASLNQALEGFEWQLTPAADDPDSFLPEVNAAASETSNAVVVEAHWDERYAQLNRAFFEAGRDLQKADDVIAVVLGTLRGLVGRLPGDFQIQEVGYESGADQHVLRFQLMIAAASEPDIAELLQAALSDAKPFRAAQLQGAGPQYQVTLTMADPLPAAKTADATAVHQRLVELTSGDAYAVANLQRFYDRLTEVTAAWPVFLTVARPVVEETFRERQYDYFFSAYFLMILTDFFGLGVIALIVILERKGIVHRYGAQEDAKR